MTPGIANYYVSSFNGQSVLVKTREGRPIKIETNTKAIFGSNGTNAVAQASVLDLYDMSKLKGPQDANGEEISWTEVDKQVKCSIGRSAAAGKANPYCFFYY